MDLRQTDYYAEYLSRLGWDVIKEKSVKSFVYVRKIPLTNVSVIKIQRPNQLLSMSKLSDYEKKYKVIQSNIEPLHDNQISTLVKKKYFRNNVPFLPGKTIIIDLKMSDKILLSSMKQKTRYNIRLSEKRGVDVKIFDGNELKKNTKLFSALFDMQKQNAKRLGVFSLPKKWFYHQVSAFGNKCFSSMAYYKNDLVAATFYMQSDDGLFYSHNGSNSLGRSLFAPTYCVWKGMLEGKRRKLSSFDFEGIFDPRSKVIKWQGFTRFKEGFGGRKMMYPGLYSKWNLFGR
ncbi:lipid II:glycine glycyltransferase FemX [Patescibacteria group bacterium]